MMQWRSGVALIALAAAVALPAAAAAPSFETPAPIAFMEDLNSGAVLYAKNADQVIPPASMAKMMTVYTAFDLIKKGELKLDKQLTVQPATWQKWHGPAAGSTMFLSVNEQVSVNDLLEGIITLSGNDACAVLAEGISGTEPAFTDLMNRNAKKLGLTNSHFGNSMGWPDGGVTHVTARDLATLATATIRDFPDLYKRFYARPKMSWGKTMGGSDISQDNRNPLLGRVEGADGLKTGHTEEAGFGFTGSAEQNGRRIVMVIAGLNTFNQRISESVSFMNWGLHAWQLKTIAPKGKQIETAEVQLGNANSVGLVAPKDLAVTVPAGLGSEMKLAVAYDGPIKAPFKAGDHIADLVVRVPGMPDQRIPLAAAADVGSAGFFDRVAAGFHHLL
jgi:D-alanyl-D-alanine carboxypeptidase (penicillin-binding protein 5/6)